MDSSRKTAIVNRLPYTTDSCPTGFVEGVLRYIFGAADSPMDDLWTIRKSGGESEATSIAWNPSARFVRGLKHKGYRSVREFAVLPSRANPKWLLPYSDRDEACRALQAYTSHSRCLLRGVAQGLASLGWPWLAGQTVVVAAKAASRFEAIVGEVVRGEDIAAAVYLGSPGRFRKASVRWTDEHGGAVNHLKVPLTAEANDRIQHEATILGNLWERTALRPYLPRPVHAGALDGMHFLVQSSPDGLRGPVKFGLGHETFLRTLHDCQPTTRSGQSVVDEVGGRFARMVGALGGRWESLGRDVLRLALQEVRDRPIACRFGHGDFTPWNTRLQDGNLVVFDWEAASANLPRDWDRFHFVTQTRSLLHRSDASALGAWKTRDLHGLYLLYLLDSAVALAAEGSRSNGVAHREQQLLTELRRTPREAATLAASSLEAGVGSGVMV